MSDALYSANPLQIFGVQIAISVFLVGLGIVGLARLFREKHSFLARGVIVVFSLIVMLAGALLLIATWYSSAGATKTMTARLTGKNIVYTNTSDSTPSPTYRLDLGLTIAFDIPDADAYGKMNVGDCYQVTYYPSFSLGLAPNAGQVGEQYPGSVSEIRRATGCK
jgi:uncharacterized membrane protein